MGAGGSRRCPRRSRRWANLFYGLLASHQRGHGPRRPRGARGGADRATSSAARRPASSRRSPTTSGRGRRGSPPSRSTTSSPARLDMASRGMSGRDAPLPDRRCQHPPRLDARRPAATSPVVARRPSARRIAEQLDISAVEQLEVHAHTRCASAAASGCTGRLVADHHPAQRRHLRAGDAGHRRADRPRLPARRREGLLPAPPAPRSSSILKARTCRTISRATRPISPTSSSRPWRWPSIPIRGPPGESLEGAGRSTPSDGAPNRPSPRSRPSKESGRQWRLVGQACTEWSLMGYAWSQARLQGRSTGRK